MQRAGVIHYAKVEQSPRLQRVLAVLIDGKAHTTLNIIRAAEVCAVNSIIAELRRNGYPILCTQKGRGVFEYRLMQPANEVTA